MGGVVVTVLDSWDVVSLSGGSWVATLVGGVVIISIKVVWLYSRCMIATVHRSLNVRLGQCRHHFDGLVGLGIP
jgi:hypothetical protein